MRRREGKRDGEKKRRTEAVRLVGQEEENSIRRCGQTDRRRDGRTDGPPNKSV